jgi:rhodanese-related sulfurtransferase
MNARGIWRQLGRDLAGFGVLSVMALLAGLAINQLHDKPLPLVYQTKTERMEHAIEKIVNDSTNQPPSATAPVQKPAIAIVTLDEFKRLVESKETLVLDARPEVFHRLGHVPGALSLPRADFEAGYARLKSRLEKDKNQTIAVYCSDSDCQDSEMVANALVQLDYRRVSLFKGGWADWTGAHLPEEKTE